MNPLSPMDEPNRNAYETAAATALLDSARDVIAGLLAQMTPQNAARSLTQISVVARYTQKALVVFLPVELPEENEGMPVMDRLRRNAGVTRETGGVTAIRELVGEYRRSTELSELHHLLFASEALETTQPHLAAALRQRVEDLARRVAVAPSAPEPEALAQTVGEALAGGSPDEIDAVLQQGALPSNTRLDPDLGLGLGSMDPETDEWEVA